MNKTPCILLLALLLTACGKSSGENSGNSSGKPGLAPYPLYILSTSLSLRAKPSLNAPKLGLLRYGQSVQSFISQEPGQELSVSGIPGRWLKVRASGRDGYVFSGFLSRLRSPDLRDKSLVKYAKKFYGTLSTPTVKQTGDKQTLSLQTCRGGVILEILTTKVGGTTFKEEALRITGISLPEGFLLARALFTTAGLGDRTMDATYAKSLKGDKVEIWKNNLGVVAVKKSGYIRISYMEQAN